MRAGNNYSSGHEPATAPPVLVLFFLSFLFCSVHPASRAGRDVTSGGQDGELTPSEAPPQCPPMAAGWGHLAITSANSVYSGINPAAKVVSLLEVKVRYPEKMLTRT